MCNIIPGMCTRIRMGRCCCSHMNSSLQCSPWSQDRLQHVMQPERPRNDRNASKVQNYQNYEINWTGTRYVGRHIVRWQMNVPGITYLLPGSNFSRLRIDKMKSMWERTLSEGKIFFWRVRSVLKDYRYVLTKWNSALSWTGFWPYRHWNAYWNAWMANGPAESERSREKGDWYNMYYTPLVVQRTNMYWYIQGFLR